MRALSNSWVVVAVVLDLHKRMKNIEVNVYSQKNRNSGAEKVGEAQAWSLKMECLRSTGGMNKMNKVMNKILRARVDVREKKIMIQKMDFL